MTKQPSELIGQLIEEGGAIVSSGDCSEMEIANARATGRFAADSLGYGYVRRTKEWLALQLAREKAQPNTDGRCENTNPISPKMRTILSRLKNIAPMEARIIEADLGKGSFDECEGYRRLLSAVIALRDKQND